MENSNGRWILPADKKATLEHELSILFARYNLEDRSKGMVRLFNIKINEWMAEIEKHKIDKPEEPPKELPTFNSIAFLFNLVYETYMIPWTRARESRKQVGIFRRKLKQSDTIKHTCIHCGHEISTNEKGTLCTHCLHWQ